MARYTTTVTTPLSPADAFAYMAEVTHFPEWDPGVLKAVRVAGDGASVGTAYELTVRAGGTTVMRYEVTERKAPHSLTLVARTTFLTSVDEVRVEPTPNGSTVTYDARLTLNGPLALLDPLLGAAFRRIGDRATAGLCRVLQGSRVSN